MSVKKETVECIVDPFWGTVSPVFCEISKSKISTGYDCTSGSLKYFSHLKGKRLRITIEVLEDL